MAFDKSRGRKSPQGSRGSYGGGSRGSYGGGSRFGGGRGGFQREMHKVICSDCGKETEVPFKPSQDRPVYCRECFAKRKEGYIPREKKVEEKSVEEKQDSEETDDEEF